MNLLSGQVRLQQQDNGDHKGWSEQASHGDSKQIFSLATVLEGVFSWSIITGNDLLGGELQKRLPNLLVESFKMKIQF